MKDGMIAQVDTPEALSGRAKLLRCQLIDAGTIVRGKNVRHGDAVEISHPSGVEGSAAAIP